MKTFKLLSGKRVAAVAFALLGGASLIGCGSDNYDYNVNEPPILPLPSPPPPPPPAPVIDAFFATVLALVANSPDDTEPGAIEAIIATTPEDTEPRPLG